MPKLPAMGKVWSPPPARSEVLVFVYTSVVAILEAPQIKGQNDRGQTCVFGTGPGKTDKQERPASWGKKAGPKGRLGRQGWLSQLDLNGSTRWRCY